MRYKYNKFQLVMFLMSLLIFSCDHVSKKMSKIETMEKHIFENYSPKSVDKLFALAESEEEHRLVRKRATYALGNILECQIRRDVVRISFLKRFNNLRSYDVLKEPIYSSYVRFIPSLEKEAITEVIDTLFRVSSLQGYKPIIVGDIMEILLKTELLETDEKLEVIEEYLRKVARPDTRRYVDRVGIYLKIKDHLDYLNEGLKSMLKEDYSKPDQYRDLKETALLVYQFFEGE